MTKTPRELRLENFLREVEAEVTTLRRDSLASAGAVIKSQRAQESLVLEMLEKIKRLEGVIDRADGDLLEAATVFQAMREGLMAMQRQILDALLAAESNRSQHELALHIHDLAKTSAAQVEADFVVEHATQIAKLRDRVGKG